MNALQGAFTSFMEAYVSSYQISRWQEPEDPEPKPEPVAVQTYGWLRATGRYIVHDKDLVLMKLVALAAAIAFGIDVAAMIGELADDLVLFFPDDFALIPETPIAIVLWLIAFRLFQVRRKINYYRYTYRYE